MSYCVNCGVELADSEKRCPLCDTEVINPRKPWREPEDFPYPRHLEPVRERANRVFFASVASLILCVPAAVTLLVLIYQYLASLGVSWPLLRLLATLDSRLITVESAFAAYMITFSVRTGRGI